MRAELSEKKRAAWAARETNGYGTRANGAQQDETRQKISDTVAKRWTDGEYAGRVNGTSGVLASAHHGWTWGIPHYRAILEQHEPVVCGLCGESEEKIDAHHLDEDHGNYLLTNLVWLCVPCHMWKFHYEDRQGHVKRPFVTLTKRFAFEYAHVLPWHPGKCARLHGHSGHLTVSVRGRLDPTDTVMDFYDLGAATKLAIVEPLDHQLLNDFIPNPTSEALLIWAWRRLESVGLKGMISIEFAETDSSSSIITAADMIEAFGWDRGDDEWIFVPKVTA